MRDPVAAVGASPTPYPTAAEDQFVSPDDGLLVDGLLPG
jgi:hypothetical protein